MRNNKLHLSSAFALLFISQPAHSDLKNEVYEATAVSESGDIVYRESHFAEFDERRPLRATTKYLDPTGKLVGEMSSDFSKNLTTPEYTFKDTQVGSSHGVKVEEQDVLIWRQEKSGRREEKRLRRSDFKDSDLLVACQGLHYYLINNLEMVRSKKEMPVKYIIPGKLDYYSFTLKYVREDAEFIHLELYIKNFFLRLFTPSLKLKYAKSTGRLIRYEGLSNIQMAGGSLQVVNIDYKYQ